MEVVQVGDNSRRAHSLLVLNLWLRREMKCLMLQLLEFLDLGMFTTRI